MARDLKKPEPDADQDKPLIKQYNAVGPAAINAALQCKAEKPVSAPRPALYDRQTD